MIGKTISHYQIIEELGRGGMGVVYKAEDSKLKRTVALKFLPPELTRDPEAKARFIREAQAASALEHPNICNIHEIDETEDGQMFIVMACYEGETLKDKIKDEVRRESGPAKQQGLRIKEAVDIAIQIAEGLKRAHEADIVHRDIKPANIIITDRGEVKILDFGLAKLTGQAQLTKDSSTLGTAVYMSPEQLSGREVDQRTDIWSLGVVLYELLTGQLPFRGEYEQALVYSIINDEPESALRIKPELPVELYRILGKSLKKDPLQRYQNIDELKSDLDGLNLSGKSDDAIGKSERRKAVRFRKKIIYGITVFLFLIVVGIGYMLMNSSRETARVIDSLAVLPLENLSGDPDQEYFSDGMTEALITELSRIKALKVISRTSVMRFKNTQKSLPEIVRQLNVTAVVEGSVLKAGDDVRITAQLIDARADKHLWAESYERNLRDILSMQKEVAKAIASQVKATLTPSERSSLNKAPVINPIAHEAYLKGYYFYDKISVDDAWKAIDYFDQSIKIEPEFAPAYAGKALAYNTIVAYNALPPKEGWALVREWAEKALKLDKNNSEAFLQIADVKFNYEWDWTGAETTYQQSILLNPNNARAYDWYALFLSSMGRKGEALKFSKKSLELAPLTIGPYYNGIIICTDAGLFKEADSLLNKVREIFPQHPVSFGIEGLSCLARGQYQQALKLFQSQLSTDLSAGMKDLARTRIAYTLARIGNEQAARQMLTELINKSPEHYISPVRIALVYLALGEKDQMYIWLDKAYAERCDNLPWLIKSSFLFREIHSDHRYQDLLKKMKLDK
ncbi:MAG: protein kinase [Calditrichaeota bacterium]|nr:protein kinase [Calditrichota bacterium]